MGLEQLSLQLPEKKVQERREITPFEKQIADFAMKHNQGSIRILFLDETVTPSRNSHEDYDHDFDVSMHNVVHGGFPKVAGFRFPQTLSYEELEALEILRSVKEYIEENYSTDLTRTEVNGPRLVGGRAQLQFYNHILPVRHQPST